jgi:hypothetical protein
MIQALEHTLFRSDQEETWYERLFDNVLGLINCVWGVCDEIALKLDTQFMLYVVLVR